MSEAQPVRPIGATPSQEQPVVAQRRNRYWERLKSNLPQKMIALICALMLFIVVTSDRTMIVNFEQIPISLTIPEGYVLMDEEANPTVNVKLSGRTSSLRGMTRDDLGTITVTPPARSGNIQVTLQSTMLSLPDGVQIEKFQPEFLDVNLEPLETRTVAVTTDHAFTGELLPGYRLGEVRIDPPEVKIMGPKSVVSNTSQLYIEPIDLTGKASTFEINRWVILNRNGLKAESESVRVTVNIVSQSKQHVILGVPIVPVNISQPHTFKPATIDLTLIGDESSLSKVDNANLFILFDASQDSKAPHARILERTELSVPNLPAGVAYDDSKFPSILFTVGGVKDSPSAVKESIRENDASSTRVE